MRLVQIAAILSMVIPSSTLADHDTAESILNAWQKYERILYKLQPAERVRKLEVAPTGSLDPDTSSYAKSVVEDRGALALLLVRNGTIVFEGYSNGATPESKLLGYSITKSMTALAVGEAVCAGKIKSLDDKAATYTDALANTAYGRSSIRNLLRMSSGAEDPGGDGYLGVHDPSEFARVARYEISMTTLIRNHGAQNTVLGTPLKDGDRFVYNHLDGQSLSSVVASAIGMPMQKWFEKTVWQKAGGEGEAGWYQDKENQAVSGTGFGTTARDFTRIGLYILDGLTGASTNKCVNEYLREATKPQMSKSWPHLPRYGFMIHVDEHGHPWLRGHGGQYIGMNASTGTLLVRLGSREDTDSVFSLFDRWALKQ